MRADLLTEYSFGKKEKSGRDSSVDKSMPQIFRRRCAMKMLFKTFLKNMFGAENKRLSCDPDTGQAIRFCPARENRFVCLIVCLFFSVIWLQMHCFFAVFICRNN